MLGEALAAIKVNSSIHDNDRLAYRRANGGYRSQTLDLDQRQLRRDRAEQARARHNGSLNLANLTDEQQIEAEDDYRICVRRGSTEQAKPKRKSRMKPAEDESEEQR